MINRILHSWSFYEMTTDVRSSIFKQTISVDDDHHCFSQPLPPAPAVSDSIFLVTSNIVRSIIVWFKITFFVTLKDT